MGYHFEKEMNFSLGWSGKLRKQLTEHQRKKADRLELAVTQGQSG